MMVESALFLGAKNKTMVEEEMNLVLDFETQLANLSLPMEERRNFTKLYNKMKLRELQAMADNV